MLDNIAPLLYNIVIVKDDVPPGRNMATFKKHCDECKEKLGNEFAEVHLWLDECAQKYPINTYGEYHRRFRHNLEGLEEIEKRWGKDGRRAGELHILTDMGFIPYWKTFEE